MGRQEVVSVDEALSLHQRIYALEAEIVRLRSAAAPSDTRGTVAAAIGLNYSPLAFCEYVAQSTGGWFAVLDAEGRILHVNIIMRQWFGRSSEWLIQRYLWDFCDAADLKAMETIFQAAWEGCCGEQRLSFIDTDTRKVTIDAVLMRTAWAGKAALILLGRDNERERLAETLLQREEERYNFVADYTFDWETWQDAEGNYRYVSPSCERISGYEAEFFLEDPDALEKLVCPEDRLICRGHLPDGLESKAVSCEFRIRRKDGEIRWVSHHCTPVYARDGRFSGRRSSNRDITDKKNIESALSISEQQYRAVFDQSPLYIFLLREDKFWRVNPATVRDFGWETAEEALGIPIEDVITPENIVLIRERMRRCEHGLSNPPVEVTIRRKDGFVFPIETVSTPIMLEDGAAVLVIGQDIRARRQAEDRILRINGCLASLGVDHKENIERLIALSGELLHGACATYCCIKRGLLCIVSEWGTPEGFQLVDIPEGHPCLETMAGGEGHVVFIPDLQNTPYAVGDPNVRRFGYRAYMGGAVSVNGAVVGSLNIFFNDSIAISTSDRHVLGILVSALGVEESRYEALRALRESEERYQLAIEATDEGLWDWNIRTGEMVVNEKWLLAFGYGCEENRRTIAFWKMIIHPEDWDLIESAMKIHFSGVTAMLLCEIRIRNKDGLYRYCLVRGKIVARSMEGTPLRMVGTCIDIADRKQEEHLLQARARFSEYAGSHSLDEIIQAVLDEAERLTGSTIGFFHFMDADQETLTLQTWSTNTIRHMCSADGKGRHYPVKEAGVWVDAVYERRAVIHNDYAALPNKKGLPEGHAPVIREMVAPVIRDNKILAILGVGNKPTNYDESDLKALCSLTTLAWDLVQRKQAEEAVQRSDERYHAMIQTSLDGFWVLDLEGRLLDVNDAYCLMSGFDRDSLLQKMVSDIVLDESEEEVGTRMDRIRKLGCDFFEGRQRHADGGGIDVEVSMIYLDTQRVILGFVREITERKKAERALRESAERFQVLIENVQAGIILIDAATHQIVTANRKAAEMCGREREEMYGRVYHQYICPEKIYECPVTDSGKAIDNIEMVLVREDGKKLPVLKTVAPVTINNRVFLIESFVDITERKQLEEQLHQAQKMEAIGHLAGGIAHDFNNLLQVILGYLDIVQDDGVNGYELAEIRKAAEWAADLTRQLLVFSRRQLIQPVDLNLSQVVCDVLKMIRRVIGEHIDLHFCPAESLSMIHADRTQVEQVLMNLCVNARDAMPAGGELSITVRDVCLQSENSVRYSKEMEGPYVLLTVSDTGIGMDEATRMHIFEPFFTTKSAGHGTGLGLATVYGIIKQHNGFIDVDSEVGRGTRFNIYLPVAEQPEIESEEKAAESVVGGSEVILVAEDEPTVLAMVTQILRSAGYRVYAAANGEEALKLFDEMGAGVDLCLLDVMMPRLSGRDVMDHIRKISPAMRFLFSSGYSSGAIDRNFEIEEGIALIKKPYRRHDLLKMIRAILDADGGER